LIAMHMPLEDTLGLNLLAANQHQAAHNREHFDAWNLLCLNVMSSPGAGKTSLLERSLPHLAQNFAMAVLEGDMTTQLDAQRLEAVGIPVVPITTGRACHLDAAMVSGGLRLLRDRLDPASLDLLWVENVSNLVCPAEFEVGGHRKVALLSVTEGDDKIAAVPPPAPPAPRCASAHQPELPPRLLGFGLPPSPDPAPAGSRPGPAHHRSRPWPYRARAGGVLIEQQHQRQGPGRLSAPGEELTSDRASGQPEEALPQQLVKGKVLGEPRARQGFGEPEGQNLAGLFSLAWHQGRDCTLATLSPRLWSLSVPLGCSWILRPASVRTFSESTVLGGRCTPTPIGTTRRSTVTFMVSPAELLPSWRSCLVAVVSVFPPLVIIHALAATVWTGGHLVLDLGVLPRALRVQRAAQVRAFEETFEPLGLTALAIQVLTGLWMGWIYLPGFHGLFSPDNPIGMLVGVKLLLLAGTAGLAIHARLRLIPNLTDDNLSGLAWHIRGITALAIAFVVVGGLIRLGGLG
jgi:hydrogenase accessory protein HypB